MNKTFGAIAALALAATMGGAAVAQTPAPAGSDRPGRPAAQPISQADFVQRRVERLRAADLNGDGSVTAEEMRTARQAAGTQRRAALFDQLDTDKDGQISRAEFEARSERGPRARGGERAGRQPHQARRMGGAHRAEGRFPIVIADAERKATEAFARLDANGDGVVTPDERQAARAQMREKRQERRAERMARRGAAASPSAPASE